VLRARSSRNCRSRVPNRLIQKFVKRSLAISALRRPPRAKTKLVEVPDTMAQRRARATNLYESSVFINVPFDRKYQKLFDALVFAVYDCGFVARCALESDDGADVRFDKLNRISQTTIHVGA
jgi:hypothetical protein